ncbi:CLUMA_CG010117, isoform A [Clunio marinus]|uniref:CLUMA_CG010117, isoform A n=1 Tax=Clunio marinus TaxID=568069 RepID=A0A1J1IDL5_9DIPT|nr:CLUMA_CG010117, isoform A [Clunio marinus]
MLTCNNTCRKLLAHEVAMSPLENKVPPKTAILRYPKHFKRAPLKSPKVIPSAELRFNIKVASSAVMFSSRNLSLKIKLKLVSTGTINT